MENWKKTLEEQLPLLGHRNWIVVTDMAYPLQANPGIQTLYAPEAYEDTVAAVAGLIETQPHVFAHIHLDSEQQKMNDSLCPGWSAFQQKLSTALNLDKVAYTDHEALILRLDEISRLYRVVIIKTPLTLPYSSTFFELDCGYWDAEREQNLRK